MELALDISNLTVFYGEDCALKEISLQIDEREFLAIIGPNGGGKTTLLKSILGLVRPDSGEIRIFGRIGDDARRSIGYVPQFSRFDRSFPISEEEVVLI